MLRVCRGRLVLRDREEHREHLVLRGHLEHLESLVPRVRLDAPEHCRLFLERYSMTAGLLETRTATSLFGSTPARNATP